MTAYLHALDPSGNLVPLQVDADGHLIISGDITIGDVTVSDVEISNDTGNPVPVSGPLTDTQLRATPVPVSGPLTNNELRANDLSVTLAGESVAIAGSVEVTNDSGNPLPVNGTVEINNDSGNAIPVSLTSSAIPGLNTPPHDHISLSYTGSNVTGVVYKTGGSSGTTVATLTLAYDSNNNLTAVTRS
jgi:hypothetical protein